MSAVTAIDRSSVEGRGRTRQRARGGRAVGVGTHRPRDHARRYRGLRRLPRPGRPTASGRRGSGQDASSGSGPARRCPDHGRQGQPTRVAARATSSPDSAFRPRPGARAGHQHRPPTAAAGGAAGPSTARVGTCRVPDTGSRSVRYDAGATARWSGPYARRPATRASARRRSRPSPRGSATITRAVRALRLVGRGVAAVRACSVRPATRSVASRPGRSPPPSTHGGLATRSSGPADQSSTGSTTAGGPSTGRGPRPQRRPRGCRSGRRLADAPEDRVRARAMRR